MTDEQLHISVSESGTSDVIQNLQLLGVSGQAAAAKVVDGYTRLSQSAVGAAANQRLMAQASANTKINIDAFASALDKLTETQLVAAANSAKVADAIKNVGSAAATGTGNLNTHGQAVTGLAKSYDGLTTLLKTAAVYLSFSELVKASDAATSIDNKLKMVTKSAGEYKTAFEAIYKTSQQTGTALEANIKLFTNMSLASEDAGISAKDMTTAVDTVAKSLKSFGTSGAQSNRAILELSESMSKGSLSGRQFLSIAMNAPGLLKALEIGLDTNREGLDKMAHASSTAGAAVATDFSMQIDRATLTTTKLEQDLTRKQKAYAGGVSSGKLSGDLQIKAQQDLTNETRKLSLDRRNIIDLENKQLADNMASNVAVTKLGTKEIVDALVKANAEISSTAAKVNLTISSAFTALDNAFIKYIGDAQKASGANLLLVDGIIAIADHLNTIIPVVAGFAAAWLAVKAYTIISELGVALISVSSFIVSTAIPAVIEFGAAALLALGPVGLAILAVSAAIVGVIEYTGGFQHAWDVTTQFITNAWGTFSRFFNETAKAMYEWPAKIEAALIAMANGAFDYVLQKIQAIKDAISSFVASATSLGNGYGGTGSSSLAPADSTSPNISSGQPLFNPVEGFATGGAFHVGGSGGTDSKLVQFMATPGERVTVQTPAQQATGAGLPHFATGGAIDLGLNGITVSYAPASQQSVTGYNAPTLTAAAITSAPTAGGAANSNTTDLAKQIADSLSIFSQNPLLFGRQVDALSYMRKDPASTHYINADIERLLQKGLNVEMVYNGMTANDIKNPPVFYEAVGKTQQAYDGLERNWQTELKDLNPFVDYTGGKMQAEKDLNAALIAGAVPWNTYRFNMESEALNGFKTQINQKFGTFHARDGMDMVVPGAGASDSRFLNLAVSPGERVQVTTPQQQRATRNGGGGQTIILNQTIQANDVDSFKRSSRQIQSAAAADLARAAQRSGVA